jgi:hypothetical protein
MTDAIRGLLVLVAAIMGPLLALVRVQAVMRVHLAAQTLWEARSRLSWEVGIERGMWVDQGSGS